MKSWEAFDLVITGKRRKRRADHRDVRGVCLGSKFLIPLNSHRAAYTVKSHTHTHTDPRTFSP